MASSALSPEWQTLADRVVSEYRAAIGDDLVAIALFGSVMRGQARPDSDLDLYVVTRKPSLGDARLHAMWKRIDASPEYQALVRGRHHGPLPASRPRGRAHSAQPHRRRTANGQVGTGRHAPAIR